MTNMADIREQAADWLRRVNEPTFDAWEDWAAWMEGDPRRAEAYWRLATFDANVAEAAPAIAPDTRRSIRSAPGRSRWLGPVAGLAAAAAVAVLWGGWSLRPRPWVVETQAGASRSLTLADGSEVHLDGQTRLRLDRRRVRDVRLEEGRATFVVAHDPDRPFSVGVGDATIVDLGTVFDVTRLDEGVRVAVAEGSVRFEEGRTTLVLRPGEGVQSRGGTAVRTAIPVEDVSGWRTGRLSYDGERMDVVAQDLSRVLGRRVVVSPALASRRVTGSIGVKGEASDLRLRLEALLGVSVVETRGGWELRPRKDK